MWPSYPVENSSRPICLRTARGGCCRRHQPGMPMFSGIMADAAQNMGTWDSAAALVVQLPAGAVTDIPGTFAASANNVSGSITNRPDDELSSVPRPRLTESQTTLARSTKPFSSGISPDSEPTARSSPPPDGQRHRRWNTNGLNFYHRAPP